MITYNFFTLTFTFVCYNNIVFYIEIIYNKFLADAISGCIASEIQKGKKQLYILNSQLYYLNLCFSISNNYLYASKHVAKWIISPITANQ